MFFAVDELLSHGDTVLAVLEYLHGQKPPVYYGDLKPDNLMLSDSGKLYLVDFWERGVWIWRKSADLYGNRRLCRSRTI